MEIIWKVCWISCLLFLSSARFTKASDEDTTPSSITESTTEAEEEEKQGDLDLETQDQVAILKQINRVNDDGSYTFGYEAADGSFKIETRDVNGNVKGMFGFINENGELKRVSYSASNGTGFQSTGTLNIPPLSDTALMSDEEGSTNFENKPNFYEQIVRPNSKNTEESSTKISLLKSTPTTFESPSDIPSPRLPIYIFGSTTAGNEITSTVRPVVIQHIPKVRPTPATSSTAPTESEEILRKPLFQFVPKRTSNGNFISFATTDATSTTAETTTPEEGSQQSSVIQVIRPRTGPYKKVIVTKRPVVPTTTPKTITTTEFQSKEYLQKLKEKETTPDGINGVRRQLGITNNYVTSTVPTLLTSGTEDSPDVYGGGHTSQPYPTSAYRSLFPQVPQHQRILQNSLLQNQNQYLAAAYGNTGPQTGVPPQVVPPVVPPNSSRKFTGAAPVPSDPNIPPRQNNYVPSPVPQPIPDVQGQRPFGIPPNFVRQQYTPTMPPIVPPYQQEQPYNQVYIPPGLIEHIIRMLLAAQMRQRQQSISPFQQAVIATLGPSNIPPELLDNRYDPRYYQIPLPYQNFPQIPNPYPMPMIPRPVYDQQYQQPFYQPSGYFPVDPRYNYQPQTYTSNPFSRFPLRVPYGVDPGRQVPEDIVLRMLFGYPRVQSQVPLPPIQSSTNVVERSPAYQPERDSTTSSTTPAPRIGSVRNVQILGQINEDSESSSGNYEESTKSGE